VKVVLFGLTGQTLAAAVLIAALLKAGEGGELLPLQVVAVGAAFFLSSFDPESGLYWRD
jgi:hypothetical protein